VLTVADLALKFGQVERATYHQDGIRPETDTDHTVMLGLIACSLAERINDHRTRKVTPYVRFHDSKAALLDIGSVSKFALVHDFVEALAGDTDMLNPSPVKVAAKEDREREALAEIRRRTAKMPWIARTIDEYDQQSCVEARFVRAVDKIMPKLTMALNRGAGVIERQDPSKVPELNRTQIDKLRATYAADLPEVVELLEAACRQSEAILAGPKCEEEVVTGVDRGVITRKGPCGAPAKHKGDNDMLLCARCAEHAFVASELPLPVIGFNAEDGILPGAPIYKRQDVPECADCSGCPDCMTNTKPVAS
jgi:5'-deoxynucleotidase YfbR-like HD superfamily hydrolase